MSPYETTSKGHRVGVSSTDPWTAGAYTLLVEAQDLPDGTHHERGDILRLDEEEATRLGNAEAIAPPDTVEARDARIAAGKAAPEELVAADLEREAFREQARLRREQQERESSV